jgi:hypothetical protein
MALRSWRNYASCRHPGELPEAGDCASFGHARQAEIGPVGQKARMLQADLPRAQYCRSTAPELIMALFDLY